MNIFYFLGKSSFVQKLLENREKLIKNCPKKAVIFHNGPLQTKYEALVQSGFLKAFEGAPTLDSIEKYGPNSLMIFDDLPYQTQEYSIENLFNMFSHHMKSGIIYLVHDLFSPKFRKIRQGAQIICLTSDFRNLSHCKALSSEIFCYQRNFLLKIMKEILSQNLFDYLLLNLQVCKNKFLFIHRL